MTQKESGDTKWFRADIKSKFIGLGSDRQFKNKIKFSEEKVYCWADNPSFKGILGTPVKIYSGISWNLGDSFLNASAELGYFNIFRASIIYNLNKHLTVGFAQDFNSAKRNPYKVGFNFTYKI